MAVAARAVRHGESGDEAEALLAGVAALAQGRADDALRVVQQQPQAGIPAGLVHAGSAPSLQRLRQVSLDACIGALDQVPDRLDVALLVERAREHRRWGRRVFECDLHAEVVVHRPPARLQQKDARRGVGRRHELSHHSYAARAGAQLCRLPQLAAEALPDRVRMDRHEQVGAGDERVGDQRSAGVLDDPGVALELHLGRIPVVPNVADRDLRLAQVDQVACTQQLRDGFSVGGRGCAQDVPGRDGLHPGHRTRESTADAEKGEARSRSDRGEAGDEASGRGRMSGRPIRTPSG